MIDLYIVVVLGKYVVNLHSTDPISSYSPTNLTGLSSAEDRGHYFSITGHTTESDDCAPRDLILRKIYSYSYTYSYAFLPIAIASYVLHACAMAICM